MVLVVGAGAVDVPGVKHRCEEPGALERHAALAGLLRKLRQLHLRRRPFGEQRNDARPLALARGGRDVVDQVADQEAGARFLARGVSEKAVTHDFPSRGRSRVALPCSIAATCDAERPSDSSACACGAGWKYG